MADTALTKRKAETPEKTERTRDKALFVPRVDIRETDTEVTVVADMPGVDETSVTVDLEGSELTIRGAFVPEVPEGYSLTYQEYETGDYERSFTLGETIDRGGIKAAVRDGVLRLVLPKAKETQPKRIAVKAG